MPPMPPKKYPLVEMVGPGGRMRVLKSEMENLLRQGWVIAPRKKYRMQSKDKRIINIAPDNRVSGEIGMIVPSAETISGMDNEQIKHVIDELELKIEFPARMWVKTKRKMLDKALKPFRRNK